MPDIPKNLLSFNHLRRLNNMDLPRTPTPHILLTGAGFTHNFGAPLASGMWSLIFNHPSVRSVNKIKKLLRRNFDYESVYHEVTSGKRYDNEERSAINSAVLEAYEFIDATVRDWTYDTGSPYPVDRNQLQDMISRFAGKRNECGFLFTLNQDLFMERHYYGNLKPKPVVPGVKPPKDVEWFSSHFLQPINETMYSPLPRPEEIDQVVKTDLQSAELCYVKLHGSHGWQSHDGSPNIVIGGGKEEQISKEPLLSCYRSIFETVLNQPNCCLLVIGYGFGDPHVNNMINKAISKKELRLIIVCPKNPEEFQKHMTNQKYGPQIWEGLEGYFPYSLLQLYPVGKGQTEAAKRLLETLFG